MDISPFYPNFAAKIRIKTTLTSKTTANNMTIRKTIWAILLMAVTTCITTAQAQNDKKEFKWLEHLDLGVTIGTTGLGIDVASPIGEYVQARTGFEIMPRFDQSLHFDIQAFDESGNMTETKFDKMSSRLENFMGYKADSEVRMVGKPTMWNFKLLVDVFPFHNKKWHLTAGFHWGPSKIAEAVNALEDAPSLVAVNIYNNIYDRVSQGLPIYGDITLGGSDAEAIINNGRMGIRVGDYKDQYVTETHPAVDENGDYIDDGNGGYVLVTDYVLDANGNRIPKPYRMEPDANCTVSANVKVNSFKPYIGFGYGGQLLKNDNRYRISFDAGLLFWGGTPSIITHDGTNLSKDVTNIGGKVGTYVDLISGVKVYPVINLRITRKLF